MRLRVRKAVSSKGFMRQRKAARASGLTTWGTGMTQQQVADRMGVTTGRASQIERGKDSGQNVLARFAVALGGRLHQAISVDDGDITVIA